MLRRFSVNTAILWIIWDSITVGVSLFLAGVFRPFLSFLEMIKDVGTSSGQLFPLVLYPTFILIWFLVFMQLDLYDGRKYLRWSDEAAALFFAILIAAMTSAGALYISYRQVSRALFLLFVLIAFFLLQVGRLIFRWLRSMEIVGVDVRNVLIVGTGETAQELRTKIIDREGFALHFAGYIAENTGDEILGTASKIREVIQAHRINDIVITLGREENLLINQIVADLFDLPVKVWVIPDYFSLILHQAEVENYAGLPLLNLRAPALTDYQRLTKRLFDISLILIGFPVAFPVLLLIALFIWLEDHQSPLFIQDRVGENGKIFKVYKFRTMVVDAEARLKEVLQTDAEGNLIHKTASDPRITRIGQLLRRTSLDELPQIINVLIGNMSLVGPRPELPFLVEKYQDWQRQRFAVPPGITGWWQVHGRSDKPMHLNTEDDIYYVQNYSLLLDIEILFRTVSAVVRGKGAY